MVELVRHTLLLGRVRLDVDDVSDLVDAEEGGEGDHSLGLKATLEHVARARTHSEGVGCTRGQQSVSVRAVERARAGDARMAGCGRAAGERFGRGGESRAGQQEAGKRVRRRSRWVGVRCVRCGSDSRFSSAVRLLRPHLPGTPFALPVPPAVRTYLTVGWVRVG